MYQHFTTPPPDFATAPALAGWYWQMLDWPALPAVGKQPVVTWNLADHPTFTLDDLRSGWNYALRRYGAITNIALPTGARAGVVVADIDPRHGGTLTTLWRLGWPRQTVIARTAGKRPGVHVYCSCAHLTGGLPNLPAYAEGIEFRADGNIVIVPPSVHPDTGRRYRWLRGHAPWEIALAPLPDVVVEAVQAQRAAPDAQTGRSEVNMADVEGIDIGWSRKEVRARAMRFYREALWWVRNQGAGRNDTLFWLSGQLLALGFSGHELSQWADAFAKEVGGNA